MKKISTLVVSAGIVLALASSSVFAADYTKDNQTHVPVDLAVPADNVHEWTIDSSMADFYTLTTSDFIDYSGKKDYEFVYDVFEFSVDDVADFSFSINVGTGQASFNPLKMNLFYSDSMETAAANVTASGYTAEGSSSNLLDQLSIGNDISTFFGSALAAGDYSLVLSGVPKKEATYTLSTLDVTYVSSVPEPSTYALMLAGLGLVGFMARRRKQA